jgi:hypothetical protein
MASERNRYGQTSFYLFAMRSILVAIVIIGVIGCGLNAETRTKITFVNNTDSPICYYNIGAPREPAYCTTIEPNRTKSLRISCSSAERVDTAGTTVVLTEGPDDREIYRQGARCIEWTESGGEIVIEQTGDRLVVTDNLPEN